MDKHGFLPPAHVVKLVFTLLTLSSGIELELRIPALSLAFRGIPIGVGPDNFIYAVFSDHHCVLVILIHSLVSDLPYRAFLNSRVNSSGFDVSILAISNLL